MNNLTALLETTVNLRVQFKLSIIISTKKYIRCVCSIYTKAECAYILLRTLVIATHKFEYVYYSRLLKRAMFERQSKNYFSQGSNEFSK